MTPSVSTQIVHIVRDEQTIGSYPAWIVPHLVETWQINREDRWYCEGMGETLAVSELVSALDTKQETIAISNFPKPPPAEQDVVRHVKVVGFTPSAGQVFLITFGVVLSLLLIALLPWLLLFWGILSFHR